MSEAASGASPRVSLREVSPDDLPRFFDHQQESEAIRMAAFPARSRSAHMAHWHEIMSDETVAVRTILVDGEVAGNIVSWDQEGEHRVGYWIGRSHWGKGVATAALSQFLGVVTARPLFAYVAKHNAASIRVLEKAGFQAVGESSGTGVAEVVLSLPR